MIQIQNTLCSSMHAGKAIALYSRGPFKRRMISAVVTSIVPNMVGGALRGYDKEDTVIAVSSKSD